jgi:two-component system nitrate/nitrite response regulator NarL
MKHESERAVRTAVVLDPHPLCHSAVAALLARFDIEVVGATTSPDAAVALLQEHKPQLLVAELELPEGREEGLRVLCAGRVADPALTVIILSSTEDAGLIDAAFTKGASAYVLKTSEPEVIATAVRQAFEPSLYLARPEPAVAAVAVVAPKLTRREREILALVSEGRSNRQVAELLWVTDQTVKFHLANVYRKLGVRSRFDAARWAFEHGVLEPVAADEPLLSSTVPANGNGHASGNGHANGNGNGNGTNGNGAPTLVRIARGLRPPARGRIEGTSR